MILGHWFTLPIKAKILIKNAPTEQIDANCKPCLDRTPLKEET